MKIHPTAIVEDGARLGADVEIGPFSMVGPQVTLGDGVRLHGHVVVMGETSLGERCEVFPGAVLGAPPQVYKIPEGPSRLEIGARCIIREQVTMHTGLATHSGATRIGSDGLFMAASHVAHDCQVGNKAVFANAAIIAGHVELGDQVGLGGMSALHQFTRVGDHGFVGGGCILVEDLVPFAAAIGNRAYLASINVNGLKRRGFSRADMHEIRGVYKALFEGDKPFSERLSEAAETFRDTAHASKVIAFVQRDSSRALCKPRS